MYSMNVIFLLDLFVFIGALYYFRTPQINSHGAKEAISAHLTK